MAYGWYYLAMVFLSFTLQRPWLMAGILVFIVLRPFIPDPEVLIRTWGQIRTLTAQIEANPANVTARRQLAIVWLERLRPGRALELLQEARQRFPRDAELLYLTGVAYLRCGNAEAALEPLVQAVEIDPTLRRGDPYLTAAEALLTLGRAEEAEDALERYIQTNSSSIQGYVLLADTREKLGNAEGSRQAIAEALDTWKKLPAFRKKGQWGWWARAWFEKVMG
ncbi:MAG TPA: tetratricopeptide repeat protein [Polyangium sp.]|nr:tetratricopeptide repeat protein [Polyangium sp.]